MNRRKPFVRFCLLVCLVWAGLTAFVIARFATDGCALDQSLWSISGFGSLLFAFVCAILVMAVRSFTQRLNGSAFKLATWMAAFFVFVMVSGQAVTFAGQAVLESALPLLDTPAGMETCLAWFTPNFLNGGDELFRALLLAFILSSLVSLLLFPRAPAGDRPVQASEESR